jgi:hypothetical protein
VFEPYCRSGHGQAQQQAGQDTYDRIADACGRFDKSMVDGLSGHGSLGGLMQPILRGRMEQV